MPDKAREASLYALGRCRRDGAWSAMTIDAAIKKYDLDGRDAGFMSRLTLGVMESEQNEKMSFCYIKQGETKITPQPDFPKPEKVTIGGRGNAKTVTNWAKCQERYAVLVNEVQGILSAASPEKIEGTANKYSTQGTAQQEPDDDLPF